MMLVHGIFVILLVVGWQKKAGYHQVATFLKRFSYEKNTD